MFLSDAGIFACGSGFPAAISIPADLRGYGSAIKRSHRLKAIGVFPNSRAHPSSAQLQLYFRRVELRTIHRFALGAIEPFEIRLGPFDTRILELFLHRIGQIEISGSYP